MSTPEAGGSYVRGADGALIRVERTIGPNEAPESVEVEATAAEAESPAAEAKKKPRSAPAAEAPQSAEES